MLKKLYSQLPKKYKNFSDGFKIITESEIRQSLKNYMFYPSHMLIILSMKLDLKK